ncbi:MAG TPA: hypothetical protein VLA28_10180 [Afifellaceae bacterium]|nr:hypothetical protein [Afifellaceae bacterium]
MYGALKGKMPERAFEKAMTLPDDHQDQIGKMILDVVEQNHSNVHLNAD